ncbi:putative fluoroacetate dehalogenase [Coleophoma cylindrospora]|uniref:Putative fluoroacetate dehalogenase n=1 Tax=Coleophoma cylindrospora TaxID=1849047 RepID=A0A3D8QPZ0_9HELO|nr:putative fluoroacetate dehalogenase [Coleophoma cylindrospora]
MPVNWDTNCINDITNDVSHMTSLGLESNLSTAASDKIFYYHRGIKDASPASPILVLLHGYPQTQEFHVVPLLRSDIPLFIPDLPGYGRSSPLPGPHDKRSVGNTILLALTTLLPSKFRPTVILAGHDRGGRVCHRLAVDATHHPTFDIRGTVLLDIIPSLTQWTSFSTAAASVRSYHWSFLANVDLATDMIMRGGGDYYCRSNLYRWAGNRNSSTAMEKFQSHNAFDIYSNAFKYEHVVRATCDDYRAGAFEDLQEEEEDQKMGRKFDVDVMFLYSSEFLGSRYNGEEWRECMGSGKFQEFGFGDGVGHFIPEEAPENTAAAILGFYEAHE